MKKLKAFIGIIICVFIVFSVSAVSYAVNIESESYKILLEHGFTEDYINSLTDTMIDKMAETIKKESDPEYVNDYDYLLSLGIPEAFIKELTESSLKQIRMTLEGSKVNSLDYESEATVRDSGLPVKTLSLQLTDESGKSVTGETVCVYWEWPVNNPLIRAEDYISASWSKDVFCYDTDTFYAEDYRRNSTDEAWAVSDSYSSLARSSLNSIGHWTKLYTVKKQVGGFMIFSLLPTHPIDSEEDYDRNVDITYTHETKTTLTAALCIVFILLSLSAVWIITEIRKRRK